MEAYHDFLPKLIALFILCLFFGSMLLGYFGIIKGWKFKLSDKFDLGYVERRYGKRNDG